MLWREVARDISMFIWLEQRLPPLYVGYINKHRDDIPPHIYEYLMIFSAVGILYTVLIEWLAELGAMHLARDETIDPLTRQLFIVHHRDEVRHISSGRKT